MKMEAPQVNVFLNKTNNESKTWSLTFFLFHVCEKLPTKNSSFIPEIWMPLDALHKIPAERRVVALVSYMNHSQFQVPFHPQYI